MSSRFDEFQKLQGIIDVGLWAEFLGEFFGDIKHDMFEFTFFQFGGHELRRWLDNLVQFLHGTVHESFQRAFVVLWNSADFFHETVRRMFSDCNVELCQLRKFFQEFSCSELISSVRRAASFELFKFEAIESILCKFASVINQLLDTILFRQKVV